MFRALDCVVWYDTCIATNVSHSANNKFRDDEYFPSGGIR